jgi:hypothetical protein
MSSGWMVRKQTIQGPSLSSSSENWIPPISVHIMRSALLWDFMQSRMEIPYQLVGTTNALHLTWSSSVRLIPEASCIHGMPSKAKHSQGMLCTPGVLNLSFTAWRQLEIFLDRWPTSWCVLSQHSAKVAVCFPGVWQDSDWCRLFFELGGAHCWIDGTLYLHKAVPVSLESNLQEH